MKIDNEVPLFAAQAKRSFGQFSFSLRQMIAKLDKLCLKLAINNLRLKMRLRDSSAEDGRDWFSSEDARASRYFDETIVVFRPTEAPSRIPTCREFYIQILKCQD